MMKNFDWGKINGLIFVFFCEKKERTKKKQKQLFSVNENFSTCSIIILYVKRDEEKAKAPRSAFNIAIKIKK